MITNIRMATMDVTDQEAALDFYTRKLGLEKWFDMTHEGSRFLVVRPVGTTCGIILSHAPSRAGSAKCVLATDDMESTAREFLAAGGTFVHAPVMQPWGIIEGELRDPDENEIVLVQPPG
ncbi:MAG: hypothetical protein EXQ81_03705 [Thermoleophilia bacterium]|nr:hypothetical protein [Thermoleophilia bacterium]